MKKKLWVGIDVSKDWIDLATINEAGKLSKEVPRFDNNYISFAKMVKALEHHFKVPGKEMMFCFENTGRYSKLLADFFTEYGYSYCEEPGLQIKLSAGMQRGTSDQAAAKLIALYAYRKREELVNDSARPKQLQALADLLAYRKRLLKSIHSLGVASKQLKEFSLSGIDQAIELQSNNTIDVLNEEVSNVEKIIAQLIQSDEELNKSNKLIQSVKGIGPIITAYLLVYTNNFKLFEYNWRKFACYIATAPFGKGSGKKIGVPATTKMGCKIIKSLMTMGARSAIQHDMQIKVFANRKESEGKHTYQIENAVKNKLLSRVFAVVKRQTPYVELMA